MRKSIAETGPSTIHVTPFPGDTDQTIVAVTANVASSIDPIHWIVGDPDISSCVAGTAIRNTHHAIKQHAKGKAKTDTTVVSESITTIMRMMSAAGMQDRSRQVAAALWNLWEQAENSYEEASYASKSLLAKLFTRRYWETRKFNRENRNSPYLID